MQHSSYDLRSRKVILHQTSDFDIDNDMRNMAEEDWIDMSIFESTAALDVGAMDSGVIFDHDNDDGSLGSVTINIFMNNNTPHGTECCNATTTVNGFATSSNLTGTPTNKITMVLHLQVGTRPLPRVIAPWVNRSSLHRPPPVLWEPMFNEPPAVPAPNHSGWDEQQKQ